MSSPTEEDLLERLRQGDEDALAGFIECRRRQLLAFIERGMGAALRGKVEPQDVLQEVSVHALRGLPGADLSDRDPFGWLCHLAEQRIVDAHRRYFGAQKRAGHREVPLHGAAGGQASRELIDLLVASISTPSQVLSRDQRHARLEEALASLPADSRQALRLRYFEGLPSKEIARRLGKSDGAVRVLLTRALRRLEQLLGPEIP